MSRPTPVPRITRLYYVPTSHQQSRPRYIYTPASQHAGGGAATTREQSDQRHSERADRWCRPRNNTTWNNSKRAILAFLATCSPRPHLIHLWHCYYWLLCFFTMAR